MTSTLLNRMAEALSSTQQEPYADTLAKFDWEKVRFASYSADDCKRIWSNISRQVCYSIYNNFFVVTDKTYAVLQIVTTTL